MNNTKVLEKCIKALEEKEPDISYIRGMLETLLDMSAQPTGTAGYVHPNNKINTYVRADQENFEEIPAAARPGPLGGLA